MDMSRVRVLRERWKYLLGSFGIVGATLIEMSRIPIFKMKENTKKFYFYLSKKS